MAIYIYICVLLLLSCLSVGDCRRYPTRYCTAALHIRAFSCTCKQVHRHGGSSVGASPVISRSSSGQALIKTRLGTLQKLRKLAIEYGMYQVECGQSWPTSKVVCNHLQAIRHMLVYCFVHVVFSFALMPQMDLPRPAEPLYHSITHSCWRRKR